MATQGLKASLRREVRKRLKSVPLDSIQAQSNAVSKKLFLLPEYQKAKELCIFMSMVREVQTKVVIEQALMDKKTVYLPYVLGPERANLKMFKLASISMLDAFVKSSIGVPEPTREVALAADDALDGNLDLIVMPGLAFDPQCNRLGWGKGYYDTFLDRLFHTYAKRGIPHPAIVAVALDEQIVSHVPVESWDFRIPKLVTATRTFVPKSIESEVVSPMESTEEEKIDEEMDSISRGNERG